MDASSAEAAKSHPFGGEVHSTEGSGSRNSICVSGKPGSVAQVRLAGVSVANQDVAFLAELLLAAGFEGTADMLLLALDAEQDLVPLSVEDREAMLRVLDDPPDALAELRTVLLGAHT
jgi:hypothetical protein